MKVQIYPASLTAEYFSGLEQRSVIYVLPRVSLLDVLILNKALKKLGQNPARAAFPPQSRPNGNVIAIKTRASLFSILEKSQFEKHLSTVIQTNPEKNLTFIPVSVFWSRAPHKNEKNWFFRLFFPQDGTENALQKILLLFLHRGEVTLSFGKRIEGNQNTLKIQRLLLIEFAKERTAAFGPMLYDNEKIARWVLASTASQDLIKASDDPLKTKKQIISYVQELAAKYNYATIHTLEKLFNFIWNRVFNGVRVRNIESAERIAKDGQVLWIPSHRSHFDYLLLSYVLFKKGFAVPHIAAGINLDFWPIGTIFRKCGAFFIRRSFAGNRVYSHTVSEYVNFLLQNSFPIEFFQEGGRSRIGKLLSPKLGMLSICLHSILQRKALNTSIVPVYFGYDKVMEDEAYAQELKGKKKKKETLPGMLRGIRRFFSNHGSVDVSFGEPLHISSVWKDYKNKVQFQDINDPLYFPMPVCQIHLPDDLADVSQVFDSRHPVIQGFVKYLADRVNQNINAAATASQTSLLCSTLVASAKHFPIALDQLKEKIHLLRSLIKSMGEQLGWRVSVSEQQDTETPEKDFFSLATQWNLLYPVKHYREAGVFYAVSPSKEMNLWWYRGTIFHLLAPFGIVATLLLQRENNQCLGSSLKEDPFLEKAFSTIRTIWHDELFWDERTTNKDIISCCLNTLANIEEPERKEKLCFLASTVRPEIEIYGFQIACALSLTQEKQGFLQKELLQECKDQHKRSFEKHLAFSEPVFSGVFGERAFNALCKARVFIPAEGRLFTCHRTPQLESCLAFFKVSDQTMP